MSDPTTGRAILPFSQLAQVGRTNFARVLLTALLTVVGVFMGQIPITLLLLGDERVRNRGIDFSNFDPSAYSFSLNLYLLTVLLPFATGLVVLLLCVRYVHRRPPRSLVTAFARVRWRRVAAGFAVWLTLTALGEVLAYALHPQDYTLRFALHDFLGLVGVVAVFIPLQIAFEEVAIRGYLHQELVHRVHQPWVGVAVSALVFGALHFANPEVAQFGLWLMAPYYIGVGLLLAVISVLDDGLELALGIHLATNVYGSLLVNFQGSALPTAALFGVAHLDAALMLMLFVVQAALFAAFFARRNRWRWTSFRYVRTPGPPAAV